MSIDYKSAGVDVEAGYRSVELIKKHVLSTFRPEVEGGLGGFGGMFSIAKAKNMEDPVLVSGTDGVGTKLKIAFLMDKHDTIGIDCVAMCVNDIICCGAEPLFFLDYIACGKNYPEKTEAIVKGIAEGLIMSGAALVGGETAEMPGFYPQDEYDLAGFSVGIVDRSNIVNGSAIKKGDTIIGLASSGLHSNGFSLVRKILHPSQNNIGLHINELNKALGDELLTPTKIYVKPILNLISKLPVKGISNITGGGFIENIPRMFPKASGLTAKISKGSWPVLPIFSYINQTSPMTESAMFNTFNMGIGMVVCVSAEDSQKAVDILNNSGESAYIIGEVIEGSEIAIC